MPDIAVIGRYWPGTSPLHRMDARAKLLLALALMAVVFVAQSFLGLAVCAAFVFGFFRLAGIPIRSAFKSIAPLAFIVVVTALLNVFFVQGGTVLFEWWIIRISEAGLWQAAFIACRLLLLLLLILLLVLLLQLLVDLLLEGGAGRLHLGVPLAEGHGDLGLLPVAVEGEHGGVARLVVLLGVLEVVHGGDLLVVNPGDDVLLLDAGLGGAGALHHAHNIGARRGAVANGLAADALAHDAQIGPAGDVAVLNDVGDHALHVVNGDGEAKALHAGGGAGAAAGQLG